MDTEEMYTLGVADAERGEPHPFYYQHYYPYRRGYDRTRRRLRRAELMAHGSGRWVLLALVPLALVIGIGFFVFGRPRPASAPLTQAPLGATSLPSTTSAPTRTPIFPTSVPSPLPPTPPPALRAGASARVVNTEGRPLRGRRAPGINAPIATSFKEGEQVRILEGPVEADGYTWWHIEGQAGAGWSAQQSLDEVVWLQPLE